MTLKPGRRVCILPQMRIQQTYLEQRLEASGMTREDFAAWVWQCRNLPPAERKNKQWQLTYPHQPIGVYIGARGPKGSRWYPHPQEVRPCCQVIDDRAIGQHPYLFHRHCRTMRHVSMLLNVGERDIRARVTTPRKRCACGKFISKDEYACASCHG